MHGGPRITRCRGQADVHRDSPAESSPIGGNADARRLRCACAIAMVLSVAAIASGGYIVAKAELGQWLLERAWHRTLATGAAVKPWPWADMHPVARLIAPAQRVDVIVLSGATGRTLAWGPGHLDGSARAGDPGNAVFTAHRDTHFAFLGDAKVGETIVVERADGSRIAFRITAMSVVAARELHLRADSDVPTLTLVTCYPFGALAPNTPWRYVVSATRAAPPGMAGANAPFISPAAS
jgi:sortase A